MAVYVPHHVWGNYRLLIPQNGLNHNTNIRELRTECNRCRPNGEPLVDNSRLGVLSFCSSTHDNHRRTCDLWGGDPDTDIWQFFTLIAPENAEEISPGELATRCNYCGKTLHFSPSNHINHNTGEACLFMRNVPGEEYGEVEDDEDSQPESVGNEDQIVENVEPNVGNQEQNVDSQDSAVQEQNNQEQNVVTQEQNVDNHEVNLHNEGHHSQDGGADRLSEALENVKI